MSRSRRSWRLWLCLRSARSLRRADSLQPLLSCAFFRSYVCFCHGRLHRRCAQVDDVAQAVGIIKINILEKEEVAERCETSAADEGGTASQELMPFSWPEKQRADCVLLNGLSKNVRA